MYPEMMRGALFENLANISIMVPASCRLDISKITLTSLSDTVMVLVEGWEASSGNAELKLQSSSGVAPLLCCTGGAAGCVKWNN